LKTGKAINGRSLLSPLEEKREQLISTEKQAIREGGERSSHHNRNEGREFLTGMVLNRPRREYLKKKGAGIERSKNSITSCGEIKKFHEGRERALSLDPPRV